jgi:Domain of unknown function (DUF1707)
VADGSSLRISDADREAAAAHLREHYAQGRLTLEEFNQRLDGVFTATTQGQLRALTCDLPPAAAGAPLPATAARAGRERAGRERRTRLGAIPVVIAALAALLVLFVVHLPMFLLPGRLAILLVIFAAARWLVRLLWGLGRGGR